MSGKKFANIRPGYVPKPKYGNKKTMVDGIEFDSGLEASRYGALKLLLVAGEIAELELQVPFVLAGAVQYEGKRQTPPLRYFADFCYYKRVGDRWVYVVEDAKGVRDRPYKIKKHLMMTVHKIEVREV